MRRSLFALLFLPLLLAGSAAPVAAATATLLELNTGPSTDRAAEVRRLVAPLGERALLEVFEPTLGDVHYVSDGTSLGTEILRLPASSRYLVSIGQRVALFAVGFSGELWRSDGTRQGTHPLSTPSGPISTCTSEAPVTVGARVFFAGRDEESGCELWVSDGTSAGTRLVKDLAPGSGGGSPFNLLACGGKVFFLNRGSGGITLWISDGAPEGTRQVQAFAKGRPLLRATLGARVLFTALEEEELWVSDGTSGGTRPITDFAAPHPFRETQQFEAFDGIAYFLVDDVIGGTDLWQSDGTAAGTRRVTDFGFATPFRDFRVPLAKAGNRLIFVADDGLTGERFWTSLGAPASVAPLAGCEGECPVPSRFSDVLMASLTGRVLFTAATPTRGIELWSTDGTGPGTQLVRDLCPGFCGSSPRGFTPLEGELLVIASGPSSETTFWLTDGTTRGTRKVAPADPGDRLADDAGLVKAGEDFFFVGDGAGRSRQLWVSDGTIQGARLATLFGSGQGSQPSQFVALGRQTLFTACVEFFDQKLWRSDGTREGTSLLTQLSGFCNTRNGFIESRGLLFFVDGDDSLWRTDGTISGTFRLKARTLDEEIGFGAVLGQGYVFPVDTFDTGSALWTSDGSVAGTRKLFDLPEGEFFFKLTAAGGRLYFLSRDRLWVSDGSLAGTRPLTPEGISARLDLAIPPVSLGNLLFFRGESAENLWVTDGTPGGTRPLHSPGTNAGGLLSGPAEFHGHLYYLALTDNGLRGLWRTDGTVRGTILLREFAFAFGIWEAFFAQLGDLLFFVAPDSEHGMELWRTDGTAAGTILVRDILPGLDSSEPYALAVAGGHLLFFANDGEHGRELWRTEGTAEGTVLLRDINPGEDSSNPTSLLMVGGRVFFTANDGEHGTELWESDGTPGGTRMVQDLAPGQESSNPEALTVMNDRLFFSADDGFSGREPWVLPLSGPSSCVPSDEFLCLGGGRFKVTATWRDFAGRTGRGHGVSLTSDTGYFWFFDPANVEAILKVLDGRGVNGHHWAFYGALSSVEYVLTVTDTETGATRRYVNPPGLLASVADTQAFGPLGATGSALTLGPQGVAAEPSITEGFAGKAGTCAPSPTRLCLNDGRFAVEASWKDFNGVTGTGKAVTLSGGDTGYFWFFGPENVEVILKVLDGRPLNGKYWVFFGALSSVEYTLTVTDTETGRVKTYRNPSGQLASVADVDAF